MADLNKEDGVLAVLLHRFETQWLPQTLEIKAKVDRGETLSEWATTFLDQVVHDVSQVQYMVDRHPELQALYARVAGMYMDITGKALQNETEA